MILNKKQQIAYSNEPGLSYFKNQISSSEHTFRQSQIEKIRGHLLRKHDVLKRLTQTYNFKNTLFVPAAIVLQGLRTVINFHTAYLVGNPVSITGTPNAVEVINKIYRKGAYSITDWRILQNLLTYGNSYEYVFLDDKGVIKSKVFRNKDSYPIYDESGNYKYFVEYWKERESGVEHFVIYYPTHIDIYKNNRLIDTKENYTGLPIHYAVMDRGEYDWYGDPLTLDLIPIQDKIENLLSKIDDAITTLSLNPVGVLVGPRITDSQMIDSNIAGSVLNLGEGDSFNYAVANLDYQSIKYELDQLYQQFNLVAAIPSSILGQNNIANVSENSMSMVYQLSENKGKQNMNSLIEGFKQRWEKIRALLALTNNPLSDDDFESLNVAFNISKPVDTKQNMENMEIQYSLGAISRRSIMEQSPYSVDTAQELKRLEDEGKGIYLQKDDDDANS